MAKKTTEEKIEELCKRINDIQFSNLRLKYKRDAIVDDYNRMIEENEERIDELGKEIDEIRYSPAQSVPPPPRE